MGDWNGTVPSILGGDVPNGDDWAAILAELTAVSAAWTDYTSTLAWTASAGSPSIGNGSLTAEYRRVGKTVDFRIELTGGSTTNWGTAGAFWQFTIPVGNTTGRWCGSAFAVDAGVLEYPVLWAIGYDSQTTVSLFKPGSGRHVNNSPFTYGTGDRLTIAGTYQSTT